MACVIKWTVVAIGAAWVLLWFLTPISHFGELTSKFIDKATSTTWGNLGGIDILYGLPVLIVALLSCVYVRLVWYRPKVRRTGVGLMEYPVIVRGPLGTITLGEIFLISVASFLIIWTFINYLTKNLKGDNYGKSSRLGYEPWQQIWSDVSGSLGQVGLMCLAFLFFPITRGSLILQFLNLSFESTVKYHRWLGHVTLFLFTTHGASYIILWILKKKLLQTLFLWKAVGLAFFPAFIAWLAGLSMWVTTMDRIRRANFEAFYYTHHLYIVFVLFMAFHVGYSSIDVALPGIFLFFLDRYLRMLQSRKFVQVMSVRKFPGKIVQVTFAKHPNFQYSATSIILVNLPQISRLEWHPFSVITSSNVDTDRLSVLIKCKRGWTEKLHDIVTQITSSENPTYLQAAIEGPYGPPSCNFVQYDSLILIGGGIGVTPLLSIISETLHQLNSSTDYVPKEIIFLYSVKDTAELTILSLINPSKICPGYSEFIKLEIHAYITRAKPSSYNEMTENPASESARHRDSVVTATYASGSVPPRSICPLSTAANSLWHGVLVQNAVVGYLLLLAIVYRFWIYPKDMNTYVRFPWPERTLLSFLCLLAAILLWGSAVFAVWHRMRRDEIVWTGKGVQKEEEDLEAHGHSLWNLCTFHRGARPDYKVILGNLTESMEDGQNVGVIASGPEKMQESVAEACRAHGRAPDMLRATCSRPQPRARLNFHSLSFQF